MHGHTNWINLVLSVAMFAVTGVLAWATWRYMIATKKMADSMDHQSKILSREFELRLAPNINIDSGIPSTTHEKGVYPYYVHNGGHYSVLLTKVEGIYQHMKDPLIQIPSFIKEYNDSINPGITKDIHIEIDFADFNRQFPNFHSKEEVSFQPIFIIRNAENKEFKIKGRVRTVY
jgi:hypothetical protein